MNREQIRERLVKQATRDELRLRDWLEQQGEVVEFQKIFDLASDRFIVVDIYLPEHQVAVELDGTYHLDHETAQKDMARDHYLHGLGVRVIRLKNQWLRASDELDLRRLLGQIRHPDIGLKKD